MKPSQRQILESAVDVMRNESNLKITLQRVVSAEDGNQYLQILTAMGVITIQCEQGTLDPNYQMADIGAPSDWTKLSKGAIQSKNALPASFSTVQNAAKIGDPEIAKTAELLKTTTGIAPASVICHPGMPMVFAETPTTAIWAYNPAGTVIQTGLTAVWTRNAENCSGVYTLLKPWVKAVLYSFPKDKDTGELKHLSGVTFGPIGSRVGIHIISKELGMVIACTGCVNPKDTPASYILNGKTISLLTHDDCTYEIIKEKEEDMRANLIDMSQLTTTAVPKAAPVEQQPAAEPQQVTPATAVTVQEIPQSAPEPPEPTVEVIPQPVEEQPPQQQETIEEVTAPEAGSLSPVQQEAPKSADELLSELIEALETQTKAARELLTAAKNFRKQYRSEGKAAKADQKLTAENAKLKAELVEVKAKSATQEATLNKFKALLG